LKTGLTSKEYWVRQAAADVLNKISEMRKAEPTLQAFTDPMCYKRNMAVDALLQALGDWDRDLRLAAAEALGRLAEKRAVEPLVQKLADPDQWVRASAAEALTALGWSGSITQTRASAPAEGKAMLQP
jgi:HEAT repeat protein